MVILTLKSSYSYIMRKTSALVVAVVGFLALCCFLGDHRKLLIPYIQGYIYIHYNQNYLPGNQFSNKQPKHVLYLNKTEITL